MPKWEYDRLHDPESNDFKTMGEQGWEAYAVVYRDGKLIETIVYFKRQV